MALKDLYTMAKADRYTADGREALIKAQETEDARRYQNGEISEKTGLMKTPNGWVEPPKGKGAAGGKRESKNGADWEKDIPNASTEELKNVVKLEEKLPKMSEQSRKEFAPKIEKAKAELAKRNASKSAPKSLAGTPMKAESEYNTAHAQLTKLKATSPELQNDFEDHRDIVLKRVERGQPLKEAIETYEKEMKLSVPRMVEKDYMSEEEGKQYLNAWEDFKRQVTGSEMGASDSAPRILTGDTRIRVRK